MLEWSVSTWYEAVSMRRKRTSWVLFEVIPEPVFESRELELVVYFLCPFHNVPCFN